MIEFMIEHMQETEIWVSLIAFAAVLAGASIKMVAGQSLFGGRTPRPSLEEHYLHGEMSTQEYEDRKSHVVTLH